MFSSGLLNIITINTYTCISIIHIHYYINVNTTFSQNSSFMERMSVTNFSISLTISLSY